jgi:hypothetical protein
MRKTVIYKIALLIGFSLSTACKKAQENTPNTSAVDGAEIRKETHVASPKVLEKPLSLNPEDIKATWRKLLTEVEHILGRPPSKLSAADWKMIHQKYWVASFSEPLPRLTNTSSIKDDLVKNWHGKKSLVSQIMNGDFEDSLNLQEREAGIVLYFLAWQTARDAGNFFPIALKSQPNSGVVTKGDAMLVEFYNDAFLDVVHSEPLSQSDLEDWKELGRSSNPVFRLLALRSLACTTSNLDQQLAFYAGFVSDSDSGILQELIGYVTRIVHPSTREILTALQSRTDLPDAGALQAAISVNLKFIDEQPQRLK